MSTKRIVRAVIFDMDGVISDTQVVHAKIESELLRDYGIEISPDDITARFAGVADGEMFQQIFKEFGKAAPAIDGLIKEKWAKMNYLTHGNVREVSGTREFIERLKNFGIPLAVASASRLQFIEFVLSELGQRDKFNTIASAEEVEKGKPEPDLFLLAARRLSIMPEDCLVIEDGINGMAAAKRAGMRCVGLIQRGVDQQYPADLLVEDLRDARIYETYEFTCHFIREKKYKRWHVS